MRPEAQAQGQCPAGPGCGRLRSPSNYSSSRPNTLPPAIVSPSWLDRLIWETGSAPGPLAAPFGPKTGLPRTKPQGPGLSRHSSWGLLEREGYEISGQPAALSCEARLMLQLIRAHQLEGPSLARWPGPGPADCHCASPLELLPKLNQRQRRLPEIPPPPHAASRESPCRPAGGIANGLGLGQEPAPTNRATRRPTGAAQPSRTAVSGWALQEPSKPADWLGPPPIRQTAQQLAPPIGTAGPPDSVPRS